MLFVIEFILESQMILNNAFDLISIIDEGVENAIIGFHKINCVVKNLLQTLQCHAKRIEINIVLKYMIMIYIYDNRSESSTKFIFLL